MGSVVSNILSAFTKKTPKKVLMLGLDNAGKTTILYLLHLKVVEGSDPTTVPTVGFNVETIKIGSVGITVWDIGGQHKIRSLWEFYTDGLSGMVYVIDIQDSDRWGSAVSELERMLSNGGKPSRYPVLVIANKIDKIPDSEVDEVNKNLYDKLNPKVLFAGRPWMIITCSAITKDINIITDGFLWLADNLLENQDKKSESRI
ncbi:ADP-ribosylation factor 1/2 [Nematocida major]|uniref:ADP-ribosylation factor 1/2 n=1 Tax=Nematocida major TaxID=1912982 RepID=UPI002008D158|nr:ADP-ribosylation factor 1/2 [Nematocida major]KAH9386891.1 ADP-ribosylation factor 1/2 [Nematocida major]